MTRYTLHKLISVCLLLAFVCTACGSPKNLSKRDAGEPFSNWEKTNYGSAKFLDGDTVFVSIFLDDRDALWTSEDRELIKTNMDAANEFLVKQGERYGKEVNLIYDLVTHPDLEYHLEYHSPYPGSFDYKMDGTKEDKAVYDLIDTVYTYIHNDVPTEEILKKYNVNSIGYLVFVDHESDRALTYNYHIGSNKINYTEFCFLNLRWQNSDRNVCGSTFAHEILHLFGAKDLYYTSEYYGMDTTAVKYAYDHNKKDIMLGAYRKGVDWEKKVSGEITDVTAYYLGWASSSKFTNKFPYLQVKEQGCFKENTDKGRDYNEINLNPRQYPQDYYIKTLIQNILAFVVIFGSFLSSFIRTRRNSKNKNQATYVLNPMLDYEEFERQYKNESNINKI